MREKMTPMKGKFIVFYGINHIGKSTQVELLSDRLMKDGESARQVKYPRYDLEPIGPLLNDYLRGENTYGITPREAQILFAMDRAYYQPRLKRYLEAGVHVVAEDYVGTSVAWGTGAGVNKDFLLTLNSGLIQPDLAFLLDGEQFMEGREAHRHEGDDDLTGRVQQIHRDLAKELGWHVIDANQDIETIHEKVYEVVKDIL